MDDLPSVPLSDHNMWYYPSHGHDSDEDLIVGVQKPGTGVARLPRERGG